MQINGLSKIRREKIAKLFPELEEGPDEALSVIINKEWYDLHLSTAMPAITKYLNFLDDEGFKVVGNTFNSFYNPNTGVVHTLIYTLQK